MEGSDRQLIDRLAWLFNHMLEDDDASYRAEAERVFVDEPEIVPMRAALEGNIYRGPNAVGDFRAESKESQITRVAAHLDRDPALADFAEDR